MTAAYLHAVMMVVAWQLLLPAGTLIARFFKVTRRQAWPDQLDNKTWWHAHRILQYGGMVLATLGFVVIFRAKGGALAGHSHAVLGLLVLTLGWLQVVSAWLRGSKGGPTDQTSDPLQPATWRGHHYDMTLRRRLFEAWHKHMGYVAMILALPTGWLGLELIGAGRAWQWTLLGLGGLAAACFVILEAHGRRIDTYQAIWGPSPEHPGNRSAFTINGRRAAGPPP